jgi:hypothetical protein
MKNATFYTIMAIGGCAIGSYLGLQDPNTIQKYFSQFSSDPQIQEIKKSDYEVALEKVPKDWIRSNDAIDDKTNANKFSTPEFNKEYQGNMYIFPDGSYFIIEKKLRTFTITAVKIKNDYNIKVFSSSSRNTRNNRETIIIYNIADGTKTFALDKNDYIFTKTE